MPQSQVAPQKKLYTSGSLGCTNAMVLFQRYVDFVLANGYEKTKDISKADVILVDTCAATLMQEEASFNLMEQEQSQARGDAKVVVCGCLPAINPKKFQERWRGDFFTPSNQFMLARILGIDREEEKFLTPYENPGRFMGAEDAKAVVLHTHVRFARLLARLLLELHRINNKFLKNALENFPLTRRLFWISQQCNARNYTINISQGCVGSCTFCVIPKAKGRTRSLPLGLIVEKIREKVEAGVRHFTLSSDDSGAYGIDIGTSIVELLRKIHEIPGKFSMSINCFDPRWLVSRGEGMKEIFAKGRVKYIQIALQSAADPVLHRMRRAYKIEKALGILRDFRARFPDVIMGTQFIAGFPGETEEDFEASRRVIQEDLFNHVFIFDFSRRPGAETEEMEGHLPEEAVKERGRKLRRAALWSLLRMQTGLRRPPKDSTPNYLANDPMNDLPAESPLNLGSSSG